MKIWHHNSIKTFWQCDRCQKTVEAELNMQTGLAKFPADWVLLSPKAAGGDRHLCSEKCASLFREGLKRERLGPL